VPRLEGVEEGSGTEDHGVIYRAYGSRELIVRRSGSFFIMVFDLGDDLGATS